MGEISLDVEIVLGSPLWCGKEDVLARALCAAADAEGKAGQVSLLLGDDATVAALNREFLAKEGPTNVLSFPPAEEGGERGFLGDIALAAETIAVEAKNQGKSVDNHAAHLVVHGFLHLLGYDHQSDAEAATMEARERVILASLGIGDPYA